MQLIGKCNLFVRVVEKDGKKYVFPEISVSSKDKDGKYTSMNVKARLGQEIDLDDLDPNTCYQIDVKQSIVNVKYDEFRKSNVMDVYIVDFDFEKEIPFNKKEIKKNPFTKKK